MSERIQQVEICVEVRRSARRVGSAEAAREPPLEGAGARRRQIDMRGIFGRRFEQTRKAFGTF